MSRENPTQARCQFLARRAIRGTVNESEREVIAVLPPPMSRALAPTPDGVRRNERREEIAMKTTKRLAACLVALVVGWPATAALATEDSLIVPAKDARGQPIGQVDWSSQVVTAEGSGVPPAGTSTAQGRLMACRAAEVEARRNLLELVQGVQITSETTVANYVTQNDVIKSQIQGLVQATTIEKQTLPDGTCTVMVRLGLHETTGKPSVAATIIPAMPTPPVAMPTTPVVTPPTTPPATPPAVPPKGTVLEEAAKTEPGGPTYTGVVIDARGLGARPAMSPKLVEEGGDPLYGSAYVSRDYAIEHGMAGYSKNLEAATRNSRVTDNPLVLKAAQASGAAKADLVLPKADALRLRTAAQSQSFLAQARVMIVLD